MLRPYKEERVKFNVDYKKDTVFSAHARLLQSKWRVKKGFPEGKLGNFLDIDFAMKTKANFLTDNIRKLVANEIANAKNNKGLISEPRIWNNLLSSQPLCFNMFGEFYYDINLATRYFQQLFPNKIEKVIDIKFEYSPGRGDLKYTGDHSAFDVFIEYLNHDKRGFIGIEVKYAESLKEETMEKANSYFKERYITLSKDSGAFLPNSESKLRVPPLSQIWRDHLLSVATKQDYDEGIFVFLYPINNKECHNAVSLYKENLISKNEEINGFYSRHLEDFIYTLDQLVNTEWSNELIDRYIGS